MTAGTETKDCDVDLLISLLRRQVAIYARLEQLSARQRDLITTEDQQQLLSLLAERQKLVDELSVLNQRLTPLREYWRNHRETVAPALRGEADQLVNQAADILRRVLGADEQDARMLSARKAQTAKQVSALAHGRQAFDAYAAGVRPGHKQLVRTDESA